MSINKDNMNIIMNCKNAYVDKMLKSPVARDMIEVGGSNAVMNTVFPYQMHFEWKTFLGLVFAIGKGKALKQMEAMGLPTKDGFLRLTLDSYLLD